MWEQSEQADQQEDWKEIARAIQEETDPDKISGLVEKLQEALNARTTSRGKRLGSDRA
jgi:hypothetical protein